MDELKLNVASNIIKLRTGAGMTQAELGEKLSYSDKTISKWERAEGLPDAYVLKQLSEIFSVSVDYLLAGHNEWDVEARQNEEKNRSYSGAVVTMVSVAGIWTLAMLVFVIFWMLGHIYWIIFVTAIPATLITLLVFNSIWRKGRNNSLLVAALVASLVLLIYLALIKFNPWQLFLVLIPAELVVFLSFRIKKR